MKRSAENGKIEREKNEQGMKTGGNHTRESKFGRRSDESGLESKFSFFLLTRGCELTTIEESRNWVVNKSGRVGCSRKGGRF